MVEAPLRSVGGGVAVILTPEGLTFPVLCFARGFVRTRRDWDDLTTTTTAGLRNKMFDDLCLVDAEGRTVRVTAVEIEKGLGPFWGYNIFLDRRVKVGLVVEDSSRPLDLSEVREKILRSFEARRAFWQSGGSLPELKSAVQNAASIRALIALMESPLAGTRDAKTKKGFYRLS